MHKVWNESVHTNVFIPPLRVYSHIRPTITKTVIGKGIPIESKTNFCRIIHTT